MFHPNIPCTQASLSVGYRVCDTGICEEKEERTIVNIAGAHKRFFYSGFVSRNV